MDQPLARLAFILFDPRSDDGLMAWNILDPDDGRHARAGVLSRAPDDGDGREVACAEPRSSPRRCWPSPASPRRGLFRGPMPAAVALAIPVVWAVLFLYVPARARGVVGVARGRPGRASARRPPGARARAAARVRPARLGPRLGPDGFLLGGRRAQAGLGARRPAPGLRQRVVRQVPVAALRRAGRPGVGLRSGGSAWASCPPEAWRRGRASSP